VSNLASGRAQERGHEIVVRPSTEHDVPAMLAIYTHHVGRGVGDLGIEPTAPEPLQDDDIKRRRKNMLRRRLPHLVAERAGEVVGYAYAVPFRKRPAYRYAVKHSIYVRQDQLHSGIGRMLLPALIEACTSAGFRQMFAYVDAENVPSQNLHETFGFRRVGLLEGVGYKFSRWTDSLLMQRALGPGAAEPPGKQGS
jgi:L-amino acid N-acyltransferase YncA